MAGKTGWSMGLLVLLVGGCGQADDLPEVYPVTGKVEYLGAGPVTGGAVEFRSLKGKVTGIGRIQSDGSFSLQTLVHSTKLDGAVAGEHRVTIHPGTKGEVQSTKPPIVLEQKYIVRKKGKNHFVLKIKKG